MAGKELYKLAMDYYATGLWGQLCDTDLFAVSRPDGKTGYVCVLGHGGEFLGLALYPGDSGLNSYWMLSSGAFARGRVDTVDVLAIQDCVLCSFETVDNLYPRDLEEIRQAGLKLPEGSLHPRFQRFRPRYYPWYLEDQESEEWMQLALRAGLEIALRLKQAKPKRPSRGQDERTALRSLGFHDGFPLDRSLPLLTYTENGGFEWSRTLLPEASEPRFPSPPPLDEIQLARLKKTHRKGIWECGLFLDPEPVLFHEGQVETWIEQQEIQPGFPFHLAIVDHTDGQVVHYTRASDPDEYVEELSLAFIECMLSRGRPETIYTCDKRSRALLWEIAKQADVRAEHQDRLLLLDDAVKRMRDRAPYDLENEFSAASDALEDEIFAAFDGLEGELLAVVDGLMKISPNLVLPLEMLEQLRWCIKQAEIPASVKKTMRSILRKAEKREKEQPDDGLTFFLPVKPRKKSAKAGARTFVISVSLGKGCYRHIRISADARLFDLHRAIIHAYGFDDDHLHAFFMDNRAYSDGDAYYGEWEETGQRSSHRSTLREALPEDGAPFLYIFDFGDDWRFRCRVLRETDEVTDYPTVIRSVGEAPIQYPGEEEDEDEDEP